MYSFHFIDLVYILIPLAALSLLTKNWNSRKLIIDVILVLIAANSFTALDILNNPVLRICAALSLAILCTLGLRYLYLGRKVIVYIVGSLHWYLIKEEWKKKKKTFFYAAIIIGIISLAIIAIPYKYMFLIVYICIPLSYGKQIWKSRQDIASSVPLITILGQGGISMMGTFDPKNIGFYSYASSIVLLEMFIALFLYIKQRKKLWTTGEQNIWYLVLFLFINVKEQRYNYKVSNPFSLISATNSFHHFFNIPPSFNT